MRAGRLRWGRFGIDRCRSGARFHVAAAYFCIRCAHSTRFSGTIQKRYAGVMTDLDAVLAANLEFYRAFSARDVAAMDALWARAAPVACLHPGWAALTDRAAIMGSWEAILTNPDAPRIVCFDERVLLYGDAALVLCEEELVGGTLAASNFFVREEGAWRLVHHQAGQIVRPRGAARRPTRLN
jgi:SnoaL-like domain